MRKAPPLITERYLQWVADEYFKKFLTTRAHLRRLMMERVRRSSAHHGSDPKEGARMVDALLQQLVESGRLNDGAYTDSKVRSLSHRGSSARAIAAKLAAKGVGREEVQRSLEELREEEGDPELSAAVALVRKRRLGPFREAAKRREMAQKDLGVMARAGFSFDLSRKILARESVEELEEWLQEQQDLRGSR